MKRAGGRSVQRYNAQIVTSAEQIILAAELTQAATTPASSHRSQANIEYRCTGGSESYDQGHPAS